MAKASTPAKKIISKKAPAAAVKKKADEKGAIGIKYSDKSAGQPQLVPIFEEIKKMLLPYEKGNLKVRGGTGGEIAVVNETELIIDGKVRKEMWFAAALVQKGYVGFYLVSAYTDQGIKKTIKPELMKCLKGKSCFHIKKFDKEIFAQIKEALAIGHEHYKKKGWA